MFQIGAREARSLIFQYGSARAPKHLGVFSVLRKYIFSYSKRFSVVEIQLLKLLCRCGQRSVMSAWFYSNDSHGKIGTNFTINNKR